MEPVRTALWAFICLSISVLAYLLFSMDWGLAGCRLASPETYCRPEGGCTNARASCYFGLALSRGNISLCNEIPEKYDPGYPASMAHCGYSFAEKSRDVGACAGLNSTRHSLFCNSLIRNR